MALRLRIFSIPGCPVAGLLGEGFRWPTRLSNWWWHVAGVDAVEKIGKLGPDIIGEVGGALVMLVRERVPNVRHG